VSNSPPRKGSLSNAGRVPRPHDCTATSVLARHGPHYTSLKGFKSTGFSCGTVRRSGQAPVGANASPVAATHRHSSYAAPTGLRLINQAYPAPRCWAKGFRPANGTPASALRASLLFRSMTRDHLMECRSVPKTVPQGLVSCLGHYVSRRFARGIVKISKSHGLHRRTQTSRANDLTGTVH